MNFNVVGIGEVLWDLLLTGPQLGGAPANFAYHAHALGACSQVVTRVGNDDLGREVIRRFRAMGLPEISVQVDETTPTGTAKVSLSGGGLAHFTIQENVAWDFLAVTPDAIAAARQADAICFGTLAQRSEISRQAIQQVVAATPADALRVFDINLRQNYYSRSVIEQSLQLANVLKLNDEELPKIAEMFNLPGEGEQRSENRLIEWLARSFGLGVVALTRGPNGSLLYQGGRWSDCPARSVEVVDTVGAGDSFTATLVMGLLQGIDLDEIGSIATEVASYVCSHAGATPPMPKQFAERIRAPTPRARSSPVTASDHVRTTATALGRWAIAQLQDSLAVGALWLIGLWILRVPWAPLWAILAAVLQIIPHFGPILGLLGPVLAAALRWQDWEHPLYVLILYAVIVVADGFLLQPYIMRRVAKVPMWASILAPLVLGFLIPFWGFLLAPPLLAVVYAYKARRETRKMEQRPLPPMQGK